MPYYQEPFILVVATTSAINIYKDQFYKGQQ